MSEEKLRLAVVGCGFVSPFYMETIGEFSNFELAGIYDKDASRMKRQAELYQLPQFNSLEEILNDPSIELVVNLTDPENHYEVSRRALESGKHVYTEKPFCPTLEEAMELARIAGERQLKISSAPCSLLGPTAQTIWQALRDKRIGQPRLVYAEMDDGPVYLMGPDKWQSRAGAHWPYKSEFEMGAALEHLGYCLSWLVAYFGPAEHVTAYSSCLIEDKMPDLPPLDTPDFSVAVIRHQNGVVSRVTCGIVAPVDRGMRIVGDDGVLSIEDFWKIYQKPGLQRYSSLRLKAERKPWINNNWLLRKGFGITPRKLPLKKAPFHNKLKHTDMDYCLGLYDLAGAILENREPVLSTDFCLHVTELTLKIHHARESGKLQQIENSFNHKALMKRNHQLFASE